MDWAQRKHMVGGLAVLGCLCLLAGCSQASDDKPKTVKIKPPTALHKKAQRVCKRYVDDVFWPVNNKMYDVTDRQKDQAAETDSSRAPSNPFPLYGKSKGTSSPSGVVRVPSAPFAIKGLHV